MDPSGIEISNKEIVFGENLTFNLEISNNNNSENVFFKIKTSNNLKTYDVKPPLGVIPHNQKKSI